jgi:hypothetical protein
VQKGEKIGKTGMLRLRRDERFAFIFRFAQHDKCKNIGCHAEKRNSGPQSEPISQSKHPYLDTHAS